MKIKIINPNTTLRMTREIEEAAKKYASDIMINKAGKKADAKKIMMLMSLGVKCNEEATVEISGEDEEKAAVEMEKCFKENL